LIGSHNSKEIKGFCIFLIEKMPALNISTNVSLDGVDVSAIQSEATAKLAKIIAGKTEAVSLVFSPLFLIIIFKQSI
jgi:hypothetical protein